MLWGAWVARSVKHLVLGFSSGHNLMAHGFEPHTGLCTNGEEPIWDSLSAPPLLLCTFSLFLSLLLINKHLKKSLFFKGFP